MSGIAVLGIDIGGTKSAAGMVDASGKVRSYLREATPQTSDGEALLAFIIKLAERAIREGDMSPERIGVGCGGPMEYPAGIVSPLHIPVWRGFPLREKLEAAFGLPVIVDNDAKALALGEAMFGAGRGARCLLGMTVSTGVGGGIVLDGKLVHGASGNAGHIGHTIVAAGGPRCECGAIGCLTIYASGTGIAHRAKLALANNEASTLATLPPGQLNTQAIADAAKNGDKLSRRLITDAGIALARGIASAAALFDLDRVVIGGGVALSGDLVFGPLRQEWPRRAQLEFTRSLQILPAELGWETGVVGAASLVLQAG